MTGSPLLVDNLIIVNPGIDPDNEQPHSLAAYDRATGKKVWSANKRKAGYSSPQLVTLQGTRQILLFDGEGVAGYDPKDGGELWKHPWITEYDMNSIQPVVLGELVQAPRDEGGFQAIIVADPAKELAAGQLDGPYEIVEQADVGWLAVVADPVVARRKRPTYLLGVVCGPIVGDDQLDVRMVLRQHGFHDRRQTSTRVTHWKTD